MGAASPPRTLCSVERRRLRVEEPRQASLTKQLACLVHEQSWSTPRLLQHPREHLAGQQTHIVGEHAEDELVDEVSDRLGIVPAFAQRPRECRERLRHRRRNAVVW